MHRLFALAVGFLTFLAVPVSAAVLVSEDFESYRTTPEMEAVWANPVAGSAEAGTLATDRGNPGKSGFNPGTATNPNNMNVRAVAPVAPTEDRPLRLRVDIYDDATSSAKRQIIDLHQDDALDVANILEMGFYDRPPAPFYAYRVRDFQAGSIDWGVFSLPPDHDQPDEVGPGWHRFEAIIRPDSIRFSLDLYADGTMDAVDLVSASPWPLPRGFNSLGWGGPWGQPSPGGGANFDNILLETVLLGDTNGDGTVNGLDVDPFVTHLLAPSYQVEADMNQDDLLNGLDVAPFVDAVLGAGAAQVVPEPSTLTLAGMILLALAAIAAGRGTR